MSEITLGFLGFGLIGGSIAHALKAANPDYHIIVYTKEDDDSIQSAKKQGIINQLVPSIDDTFLSCHVVFLCAPVLANLSLLREIRLHIQPTCIITDVGSVKGNIHAVAHELSLDAQFIGGHPMAGSEKTGFENANEHLLENAYYLLTPTEKTSPNALHFLTDLIRETGAICLTLDADTHDRITALISHVPHIIAATLVNMVRTSDDEEQHMKTFAAGGFKDITRIASSSPDMWESICLSNPDCICDFLSEFKEQITTFTDFVRDENGHKIHDYFQTAGEYRRSIPNGKSSMIARCFEIYVDIPDEAGAIATIATLLAASDINIKNIGILHNREFEDGVLRIELDEEAPLSRALALLQKHGYTIYERTSK